LLPTNRLGLGRLRRFGPSPAARATFRYASLRVRRGAHSKNRVRKVQERPRLRLKRYIVVDHERGFVISTEVHEVTEFSPLQLAPSAMNIFFD